MEVSWQVQALHLENPMKSDVMQFMPLCNEILEKRSCLPEKPAPITLLGRHVRIEPLVMDRDARPLFEMSNGSPISLGDRSLENYDPDALIWRYMFDGPFNDARAFEHSLVPYVNASNALCLCVSVFGNQVGIVNFMNNSPQHLKIEIGGIWYSPIVQRTSTNTEATYLLLKHAFELGYRRLEWKCDALNERSRRAALRMGFTFEGIQQNHMIMKGRSRDTAWYRILDTEWPNVKEKLESLLLREFDKEASQIPDSLGCFGISVPI